MIFPQIKLLDIAGPLQVFTDACRESRAQYEVTVVSLTGGKIATDTVLPVTASAAKPWRNRSIDTLIVAGGNGSRAASRNAKLVSAVRQMASRSRRVGSVCSGAFVTAAAGLLDNRRAVTHWDACAELAETYPKIRVETDPIYIKDGNVWSSAGVTAGIDMALAMVAEDFGKAASLAVARSLVSFMVRPGGQSQFSAALVSQSADTRGQFDDLHGWILGNLKSDLSVERLAAIAKMSSRNFSRIYASEIGISPAKAVEAFRLEAARRLLEDTSYSIKEVARTCGFGDEERLRRSMQRSLHVSPSDYRQRFAL